MNTTARHISYLLVEHDIVVVPAFGVFRRNHRCAVFENGVLVPPADDIVFIADESVRDNKLSMSIARSLVCDPQAAAERVSADVAEIKSRLQAGQCVAVGSAGSLRNSSEYGGAVFVSEIRREVSAMSWLAPIEPLRREEMSAEKATVTPEEQQKRSIFLQSLQRTASSAAVFALLVLIAFVASQLPRRQTQNTQAASFGFEGIDSRPQELIRPEQESEKALVLIINTPSDGMSIVDPSERKRLVANEQNDSSDSYYLVVASLASVDDARKFIAAYPEELGLKILETEGRCRVYAASGNSFAATKAAADAAALFERFPSAWICHN